MPNVKEMRKMTAKDLKIELARARYKLGSIEFAIKAGQNQASHELKEAKKQVARILTLLNALNKEEKLAEIKETVTPDNK